MPYGSTDTAKPSQIKPTEDTSTASKKKVGRLKALIEALAGRREEQKSIYSQIDE